MVYSSINGRFCAKEKFWSRITPMKLLNSKKKINCCFLALRNTPTAGLPSTLPCNKTYVGLLKSLTTCV